MIIRTLYLKKRGQGIEIPACPYLPKKGLLDLNFFAQMSTNSPDSLNLLYPILSTNVLSMFIPRMVFRELRFGTVYLSNHLKFASSAQILYVKGFVLNTFPPFSCSHPSLYRSVHDHKKPKSGGKTTLSLRAPYSSLLTAGDCLQYKVAIRIFDPIQFGSFLPSLLFDLRLRDDHPKGILGQLKFHFATPIQLGSFLPIPSYRPSG